MASEEIAKQYHSYLTGISGISPRPNLTPGLFFFIQAYEIMSQLICFNGQRRILEEDKNVAAGKTSPFEWFYKSYSCLLSTAVIVTHTLKARQKQNNNNKLHAVIWFSLYLQRHRGSQLRCAWEILFESSNRHFWATKTYRQCKLYIKFELCRIINDPLTHGLTSQTCETLLARLCELRRLWHF